mgnify:CR=1 FL=1
MIIFAEKFGAVRRFDYLCTVQTLKTEDMRKFFISAMLMMATAMMGQSMTRAVELKTTDLGNQRLEAMVSQGDTIYRMVFRASEVTSMTFVAVLGDRRQAEHILTFLLDAKPRGNDIIDLENPTHNYVKKNSLGGFRVYSEGRAFSQQLRKPNIRGFINAIQEFCE